MTETRQILCDNCGRDITFTGNSIDYRTSVRSERMSSGGGAAGAVTDMMIYPVIKTPLHFCNGPCLVESDWFESMVAWRERLRGA